MLPEAQPLIAPDQQAEDAQTHREILNDLIAMGADLARLVVDAAKANAQSPDPASAPDPTIPFDRIARCVRRSILLVRTLAEPPPAPAASQAHQRIAARKRVIREVEDAIQQHESGARAESLHAELVDRLGSPDFEDDLAARPVADIIADIRRDLGVAAHSVTKAWKRRTPDDIAALCSLAAGLTQSAAPAERPRRFRLVPAQAASAPPETRPDSAARFPIPKQSE